MPKINPKKDFILFDWDNTLADSWGVIHNAMMYVFDSLQMPRKWNDIATTKHTGQGALRTYFPYLFGDRVQEATDFFYEYYNQHHAGGVEKLPGANELIDYLYKKSIKWGVISNKRGDLLRKEAETFGWLDRKNPIDIPRFQGSRDCAFDKPQAGAFTHFQEINRAYMGGLKPIYIGDMAVDAEFAQNIGVKAIIIGDKNIKASKNVDNLHELLQYWQ